MSEHADKHEVREKGNMKTVASRLAQLVDAYKRCQEQGKDDWMQKHAESIHALCKNHLPGGSGVDRGTTIDLDASNPNKLRLNMAYHHMNENGMYDGWTEHDVVVTPDLMRGFVLKIGGRNRNDIKDYLYDIYREDLSKELEG